MKSKPRMSKIEQARQVFLEGITRKQERSVIIDRLMLEVHLTEFGAQTYYNNVRRDFNKSAV